MEETTNLQDLQNENLPNPEAETIPTTPAPEAVAETEAEPAGEAPDAEVVEAAVQAAEAIAEQPEAEPEPEVEPEVDYSAYTREELVAAMRDLLGGEVQSIKNRVSAVRARFGETFKLRFGVLNH